MRILHKFLYKGAFALTGQALTFKHSVNTGTMRTYTLTGQAIGYKRAIPMAQASFTLTAQGSGTLAHTVHA